MRVLVTGITGFAGSHLADYALAHHPGVEVHGTRRWRSKEDAADHLVGRVMFHECDMTEEHNVYQVVEKVKKVRVIQLAARSYIPTDWDASDEAFCKHVSGLCIHVACVHN